MGVVHVLNWSAIDSLSEFIELILVQCLVVFNTISILINNSSWLELGLDEVLMWLIGLSKVNLVIWNVDQTVRLSKVIEMLELDGRDLRRVEEGKSHS